MRNPLYILFALILFFIVVFSAPYFMTNAGNAQYSSTMTTSNNQSRSTNITSNAPSLKGFTLGAALPTFVKFYSNESYYQVEKSASVSGVNGKITAIYFIESIDFDDFDKILESNSDLVELTVSDFNAKWGIPIITSIMFNSDSGVLCKGNYIDGGFHYFPDKSQFAQNVSDFYSVNLKFDKIKQLWVGERNNLSVELSADVLYISDIKLKAEIERKRAEFNRIKAQQQAKDF